MVLGKILFFRIARINSGSRGFVKDAEIPEQQKCPRKVETSASHTPRAAEASLPGLHLAVTNIDERGRSFYPGDFGSPKILVFQNRAYNSGSRDFVKGALKFMDLETSKKHPEKNSSSSVVRDVRHPPTLAEIHGFRSKFMDFGRPKITSEKNSSYYEIRNGDRSWE